MKMIRNFMEIGGVGSYIKKSSDMLKTEKIKIQQYINEISKSYQGVDSAEIINGFLDTTNKIDTITQNLDYYGNYMTNLANYDRDNLESVVLKLNQVNSDMSVDNQNIKNNISETKINIDKASEYELTSDLKSTDELGFDKGESYNTKLVSENNQTIELNSEDGIYSEITSYSDPIDEDSFNVSGGYNER